MDKFVILDAGVLGDLSNPSEIHEPCREWAKDLKRKGTLIRIPEIADYEIRRKLIQFNKGAGIAELDRLHDIYGYLPISTDAIRLAAVLWANLRIQLGKPGCDDSRIDADVIIAAQAMVLSQETGAAVVIATGNVRHFAPLVDKKRLQDALSWRDISP